MYAVPAFHHIQYMITSIFRRKLYQSNISGKKERNESKDLPTWIHRWNGTSFGMPSSGWHYIRWPTTPTGMEREDYGLACIKPSSFHTITIANNIEWRLWDIYEKLCIEKSEIEQKKAK